MDYKKRIFLEDFTSSDYSLFVLGADVGGTNTNICIAGIKESKPVLLYSFHYKSNELKSLTMAFQHFLSYSKEKFDITVSSACIGAAGIVSEDRMFAPLTNVNWNVDCNELKKDTYLSTIHIINDFQAIGYGVNFLDPKNPNDLFIIRKIPSEMNKSTKVIIGAGTGLGKSILVYNKQFDVYMPIPTEGGHTDFPVHNELEMDLVYYVKEQKNISEPVTYEELLSGRGLEIIYDYVKKSYEHDETNYSRDIESSSEKAAMISKYRAIDPICKKTFSLFTRFYARCAKNFALDTLAKGGVYIAGGIASKNKDIFVTPSFIEEFEKAYRRSEFLSKVPLSIIMNYDVSLYGTSYAAFCTLNNNLSIRTEMD